jgi:hypothetical protein
MKPGDDGGSVPSSCLLLRRRRRKQQPNSSAAMPRRPNGTPTPMPIFWDRVKPVLLKGGASGSVDALELGVRLALEVFDREVVVANDVGKDEISLLETSLDDAVEEAIVLRLSDPDGVAESEALTGTEFETGALVSVGWSVAVVVA